MLILSCFLICGISKSLFYHAFCFPNSVISRTSPHLTAIFIFANWPPFQSHFHFFLFSFCVFVLFYEYFRGNSDIFRSGTFPDKDRRNGWIFASGWAEILRRCTWLGADCGTGKTWRVEIAASWKFLQFGGGDHQFGKIIHVFSLPIFHLQIGWTFLSIIFLEILI